MAEKKFSIWTPLNSYTYDVPRMVPSRHPMVLIADDNEDTREMYALYLGLMGYHVEMVVDGHEAVLTARSLQPDIIIMDLLMPKLDGWNALRELQHDSNTAAIPVIVLTGHDFKAFLKPAVLAAGAVSYLMKPCLPERLAYEVGERLRLSGTGRATASGE